MADDASDYREAATGGQSSSSAGLQDYQHSTLGTCCQWFVKWACIGVLIVALVSCIVCSVEGKAHAENYLLVVNILCITGKFGMAATNIVYTKIFYLVIFEHPSQPLGRQYFIFKMHYFIKLWWYWRKDLDKSWVLVVILTVLLVQCIASLIYIFTINGHASTTLAPKTTRRMTHKPITWFPIHTAATTKV